MTYVRHPLSLRNVEDLLAERGIEVSTSRLILAELVCPDVRRRPPQSTSGKTRSYPQWRWHLDEISAKVNDKLCYLWLAVDHEGEASVGCSHVEARQWS